MPESPSRASPAPNPELPEKGRSGRLTPPPQVPRSRAETSATSAERRRTRPAKLLHTSTPRQSPPRPTRRRAQQRKTRGTKIVISPLQYHLAYDFLTAGGRGRGLSPPPGTRRPAPGVRGFGIASSRHPDHAACTRYTRHQRRVASCTKTPRTRIISVFPNLQTEYWIHCRN